MAANHTGIVVVLTALDSEYAAVRALLRAPERVPHPAGTIFEVGGLDGQPGSVALAGIGAGNQAAAVIAERAITTFRPAAVLFVGVAGALHRDLEFGTVVVATKVYGYQGATIDDSGSRARPQAWFVDHTLEQLAREIKRTGTWDALLPKSPDVEFRPVAAGDVVLNSRETPLADQLHTHYADAAAIEMESAGTATAAHLNRAPFLTVRGISDKADGNKHSADRSGWQSKAATNAAAFAIAVIRSLLASVPASATQPTRDGQRPPPHVIANRKAYQARHDMRTAERTAVPDMLSRTALAEPVEVVWRAELLNPYGRAEPSALEAHLIPTAGVERLEVRRLNRLSDDLPTLGRSQGLFSSTEPLQAKATDEAAWARSTDHRTGPSGLAVLRNGQRSAWSPLPKDMLGAILDPDDLMGRLTQLLRLLTSIDLPAPKRVAFAVGIEPAALLADGRVRELPRSHVVGALLARHVRVPPKDVISYLELIGNPAGIADELGARLHAVFRRTR